MNKIAVLLIITIFSGNIYSQVVRSIGLESGLVWSTQRISGYETANDIYSWDFDYKPGMNLLVTMDAFEKKPFSFLMSLGVAQKGMVSSNEYYVDNDLNVYDSIQNYTNSLTYLSYCPGIRIWNQYGKFIPSFIGSIRLDYEIGCNYEFLNPDENIKVIAGINLGLSAEYILNNYGIALCGYYQHDFTPQHHERYRSFDYESFYLYNKAFLINLGIKYYFQKSQQK